MAELVDILIDVNTEAVVAKLDAVSGERLAEALASGLNEAAEYAVGEVVQDASAKGLQSRSGSLLSSLTHWIDDGNPLAQRVGVPIDTPASKYSYLLTWESVTIKPTGHKYLAIPIGENLTGAGLARWASPRDLGDEIEFRGRTAGIVSGRDYTPLFVFVTQVTVEGVGAMEDGMTRAVEPMTATVQEHIDGLIDED